ncbi:MAG: cell division protein ZipA [Gammaproteobacteria bacterium]
MHDYSNFILLGLVVVAVLATTLITLKVRSKKRLQLPKFDEIDDVLLTDDNASFEEITPMPVHRKSNVESQVQSTFRTQESKKAPEDTLADLGFSDMQAVFNDEIVEEKEKWEEEVAEQENEFEADVSFTEEKNYNDDIPDTDLIVLHITAHPNEEFMGYALLQALLAADLRFGEMSIFHRHQEAERGGKILFSVASATEPGIFDINNMGAFKCKGLTMFLQMIEPIHNLAAFELFLITAQQLAEDLDGILLDDHRRPLNDETINRYRVQIRRHLANVLTRHAESMAG